MTTNRITGLRASAAGLPSKHPGLVFNKLIYNMSPRSKGKPAICQRSTKKKS